MNYEKLSSPDVRNSTGQSRRMSQLALAVGSFAIGTAEFVSMGLLPEMAKATSVDIPTAGHYIAAYAFGVVVGAPIFAVLTAKLPRKTLIVGLLVFYALANILSAFSFNYTTLISSRFISGLPHGIFFGVASIAVSSMVPLAERPKAIGNVMLGLTIATVIGAPAATFIGQVSSWSVAFIIVGVLALVSVILVSIYLPHSSMSASSSPLAELGALKQKQVWLMLAVVSIGSGGLFAVFSYIKNILMFESGYILQQVPFIMPLLGCGMVAGNIIGPKISAKLGLMRTIFFTMAFSTCIYVIFYFLCQARLSAAFGCFLVGLSFASMPSIQTRIMDVAANAQTLAGALIQSAFNLANAIGARAGGYVLILGFGYADTAILAALLTLGGLLIFYYSWHLEKRDLACLNEA